MLRIVIIMSALTYAAAKQASIAQYHYVILFCISFSDIDECGLGTHQCAQNCSNTVGSNTCIFSSGYTLNADGQCCDGMNSCIIIFAG